MENGSEILHQLLGQARISIIIPMYNAADYLRRCLDSLLAQTFGDFEALLINDGSTDQTAAIAKEYTTADSRFRLVNQPNGGVAAARNTGLLQAKGEFIAFVDSDDFVAPQFLLTLYNAICSENADVACCNFNRFFPKSGRKLPHFITKQPGTYSSPSIVKGLLHDTAIQSYLWNKLWRRSLFTDNGITFPCRCFEDTQVAFRLVFHATRIVILPDILYNYTQRGSSLVHTLNPQSENDFLASFASIRTFLEDQGVFEHYRNHFRYFTVKSYFFVWGVVFLIHFRCRNFGGFWGNLKRPSGYLAHYASRRFHSRASAPESNGVIREPDPPPRLSTGWTTRVKSERMREKFMETSKFVH